MTCDVESWPSWLAPSPSTTATAQRPKSNSSRVMPRSCPRRPLRPSVCNLSVISRRRKKLASRLQKARQGVEDVPSFGVGSLNTTHFGHSFRLFLCNTSCGVRVTVWSRSCSFLPARSLLTRATTHHTAPLMSLETRTT